MPDRRMNPHPTSANSRTIAFREYLKTRLWTPQSMLAANSTTWVGPALASIVVLAIGSWLAAALNIWIDEAYTMHTTGSGIPFALGQASAFELQPPFYFLFLSAWRLMDESSVAFARFPSVAFTAAAAAIVVVASRRVAPRLPPIAVALATALNPIVIWASVEMRVYPLVLLVSAALALTFIDGFVISPGRWSARVWYVVAGIVGLYTQFYVGFILLAFFITFLFVRRGELRSFLLANVIIGITFLPFVPVALKEMSDASGADVRHVTLLKALHEIANANFVYVLPHDIAWAGSAKIVGFLLSAALAGTLLFVGRPRLSQAGTTLVACWGLASLVFSLVFALAGEVPDVRRHAIAIAPIALLCVYALLSGLQARRRSLLLLTALTFAVFTCANLWLLYRPPLSKGGDWQRVAALITVSNPTAPVIIFPSNLALPLGQYLPSHIRVVPFPRPMIFSRDYLTAMTLQDQAQVVQSFRDAAIGRTAVWMVSDNSCDPGPQIYDFSCSYLTSYLREHYTLRHNYVFHGAVANLYEPLPETKKPHG